MQRKFQPKMSAQAQKLKIFEKKPPLVKMFLKPVWEGKMHGVTKICVFRPLFCVRMLGKSANFCIET